MFIFQGVIIDFFHGKCSVISNIPVYSVHTYMDKFEKFWVTMLFSEERLGL